MISMFMIVELILSIFLEKTTKKDNKNSSIPSSQTEKDESSLGHQGSNGKGKNENDALAKNTRVYEQVIVLLNEAVMRIPVQSCHPLQTNAATHSILKLPLIPVNVATLWW